MQSVFDLLTVMVTPLLFHQRIVREASFDIESITEILTFLNFVQSALKWVTQVYRPQIEPWITAAHGHAISHAQARLKAFESNNQLHPASNA